MERCCATVHYYIGRWPKTKRCERSGKVESKGKFYCAQHSPDVVAKREADTAARHKAAWLEKRKEFRGPEMFKILEQIAAGHNDPRSLAKEFLENFNA